MPPLPQTEKGTGKERKRKEIITLCQVQITPPGFAAPDLHEKTESPKHKINTQTLTVLPQDIPSHLPSPASQESPRLPSGASKLWQQWIHAHVARWAQLCIQAAVLSPGEQSNFRGNSILALNLPLPSTVQTPALPVPRTGKLFYHSYSQKFSN